MDRLRRHPYALTLLAVAIAAAAAVAIAAVWGFARVLHAFSHPHWGWLILAGGATLLAPLVYVLPYRIIARLDIGHELSEGRIAQVVVAGFAPFAPAGGFGLDQRVLSQVSGDRRSAAIRVLGLGALEWALLAPAACLSAIALLADGDPRPMPSLLWPWAILVPVGFAVGLRAAHAGRRRGWMDGGDGWRESRARGLRGIDMLRTLLGLGLSGWVAWLGMALYWGLDIAGFYGSIRFIGLGANVGEAVVAYATGYALTRRTMPLGGAALSEVLMTFALHWCGQPVAGALAAVVVYRIFNLLVPAVPGILVKPRVEQSLATAREAGRPAAT